MGSVSNIYRDPPIVIALMTLDFTDEVRYASEKSSLFDS